MSMDVERGNRLPVAVVRAFFKSAVTDSKWFELDLENLKGGRDPKATETFGSGIRYCVNGIPLAKFEGKVWQKKNVNYAAAPYSFDGGRDGQLQVFLTDPPVDTRKHVLNCKVITKDGDELLKDEGAQALEIEFMQNGHYWRPGATLPNTVDTYVVINPDNLPPVMPPAP